MPKTDTTDKIRAAARKFNLGYSKAEAKALKESMQLPEGVDLQGVERKTEIQSGEQAEQLAEELLGDLPEPNKPDEQEQESEEVEEFPQVDTETLPTEELSATEKQKLLEEMDELRRQNKILRENGKEGLTVDPSLWDAKHKAERLQNQVNHLTKLAEKLGNLLHEEQQKPKGIPAPTWEGKEVRILIPCRYQTNLITTNCLIAAALDLGAEKVGFHSYLGDSMIYHARNILADNFLNTESEWSLWVDDDMIFPVGRPGYIEDLCGLIKNDPKIQKIMQKHFVKDLIAQAKAAGHKILAGTYFGRRVGAPMVNGGNQAVREAALRCLDQIHEVPWAGTGFLLVHRDVYQAIKADDQFSDLKPFEDPTQPHRKTWDFFRPNEKGGEDVAFCDRAAKVGYKTYLHTGVQALHIGNIAFGSHNVQPADQPAPVPQYAIRPAFFQDPGPITRS